jgi:branched-chain amino acid transport system substrate-binding protein
MTDTAHKSRRNFIRNAASLLGAALATPALALPAASALTALRQGAPLRVGVLLPRSTLQPTLGANFLAGLRLALAAAARDSGRQVEVISEDIGSAPALAAGKARRLLEESRVQLVIGLLQPGLAATLRPLFEQRGVPLLVAGAGANLPRQHEQSPFVFHNDLNLFQADWALGRWAGGPGKRAVIVTSFYDSGYDLPYAFAAGFTSSGGALVQTLVSDPPGQERRSTNELLAAIRVLEPEVVYLLHSGPEAAGFAQAFKGSDLAGPSRLVVSGLTLPDGLLARQGSALSGIHSVFSWAVELDTDGNREFNANYQAETLQLPDAFAALGFDTGRLLDCVLEQTGEAPPARELLQALGQVQWSGARGAASMDLVTHSVKTKLYLRESASRNGRLFHRTVSELAPVPHDDPALQELASGMRSGWLHPYLAI